MENTDLLFTFISARDYKNYSQQYKEAKIEVFLEDEGLTREQLLEELDSLSYKLYFDQLRALEELQELI